MADAAAPTRRESDGKISLSTSTAAAGGLAGGASLVLYAVDCIRAGQLQVPDNATCLMIAVLFTPLVHAIGRVILYHLDRLGGANA